MPLLPFDPFKVYLTKMPLKGKFSMDKHYDVVDMDLCTLDLWNITVKDDDGKEVVLTNYECQPVET